MAASTITRATITDGSGGTTFNSAFFGTAIYDNVDALLSAALTIGGVFTAEGFGTNTFSAGGTGSQLIAVRNTSAGTSMLGGLHVGNDTQANMGRIEAYSSTYTASGPAKVNGVALRAMGAGGLALSAEHNTGEVYIYAAGTTKLTTYNGDYYVLNSPAAGQYALGGILDGSRNQSTVGTDAATTEKDLHTFSLPAGTLAVDGQEIVFLCWGTTAANTTQKNIRLYFGTSGADTGGSVLDAGVSSLSNGGRWRAELRVIRTGAATQEALGQLIGTSGNPSNDNDNQGAYTATEIDGSLTETLSGAVTVKVTGQNGTANANDITVEGSRVIFYP